MFDIDFFIRVCCFVSVLGVEKKSIISALFCREFCLWGEGMVKKVCVMFLVLVVGLLLTGCAPGPNIAVQHVLKGRELAGFWLGLWHGWISLVTFIVSLFSKNVNFYEVYNNGGWYNFGFMVGSGTWTVGVSRIRKVIRK